MSHAGMFEQYIAAFNAGDTDGYARFYAPQIRFRNGASTELVGPAAIVDYYRSFSGRMSRVIEVRAVAWGERAFAAALASRFTVLADKVPLGGGMLGAGDRVHLESMALYELDGAQFARIEATTLTRRIERREETSQ